jgi:hypothetical protein
MTKASRVACCCVAALLAASVAGAQAAAQPVPTEPSRPATTTTVPYRVALSVYRTDVDFQPGSTDVAHIAVAGSVAVQRHVEIFGAWFADTSVDLTNGVRWGAGLAYPTRRRLRVVLELHGERYTHAIVTVPNQRLPYGNVEVPVNNAQRSPVNLNLALTWLTRSHLFVGAAFQLNINQPSVGFRSMAGIQARVGIHPGRLVRE